MNILRKTLLAFGVSMLISIVAGFLTSEVKYFYLKPGKIKTEITKANYEMYFDKSYKWQTDYTKFTSIENIYNTQLAVIYGLVTFSVLIILISLVNNNSLKNE